LPSKSVTARPVAAWANSSQILGGSAIGLESLDGK
jgi:hypothetical protein